MPASRPAFPSEPNLRRLGVGGSGGGGGGDRTLRVQILVAVVLGFALVAAVLYVLRGPRATSPPSSGDGGADGVASPFASGGIVRTRIEPPDRKGPEQRVQLGPIQRVKCSSSAKVRGNEGTLCDALPYFEEALTKAILESVECAPRTGKEGTLNYVLTIDFASKRLNVFPGQSGLWKGPQAKSAAECVQRALAAPKWETLTHQYRYYMIAVLASYPAPDPLGGFPAFE
jgi:hypothetical protein